MGRNVTDKAYTDASASFGTLIKRATHVKGGGSVDKVVNLAPRGAEGPPTEADAPSQGEGGAPPTSVELSSAIQLVHEASEAIRISEERAWELEAQLDSFAIEAAEEMRRLNAALTASEQKLARTEERLRSADARAHEAETWLVRLHDAVHSAFMPLQRRPQSGQNSDRSQESRQD